MNLALQKIWFVSWPVVLIAGAVYICLVAILILFQSRFIYFPERRIFMTPKELRLSFETVTFKAADGIKLSGWFVPAEGSRGLILFCHGNAGNISHRLESVQVFHQLGLSTFIFDYRGYGQSEGKPTEQGTYLDVEASWRYLVEKRLIEPSEIILFGRSLGGAIAARLAQYHTPKALIVESTFTSVRDIAAKFYPYLPVKLFLRFKYDTMEYLHQVKCPVLIVHSRDDELIPFSHGCRLFETANTPKEFLEIEGTHNEGFVTSAKQYESGLNSFISKYIGSTVHRYEN